MKKPNLDEFEEALRKTGGNLTQTASLFGVTRQTIYNWCNEEPSFKAALGDQRKRLFDSCLDAARLIAVGIPIIDQDGKMVGWKERPDGQMLRYLMSTLGRDEGFGEQTTVNLENPLPTVINIIRDNDPKQSE